MKKMISFLLILCLCLPLVACGNEEEVSFSIPSEILGEKRSQEEYDAIAKENGWTSLTLNEDATLTYVMTKSQHNQLLKELRDAYKMTLDNMVTSGDYPTFKKIDVDDNFTEFKVTLSANEVGMTESFSTISFFMMSGTYNMFNGVEFENCKVTFISEETGEVIDEINSGDF